MALLLQCVLSTMPPGYEDEVFCPKGMCLREKSPRPRGTGSRLRFLECFDEKNNTTKCRPRAWGNKVDPGYKNNLLREGWQPTECNTEPITMDTISRYQMLFSRLDSVIGKLAGLAFIWFDQLTVHCTTRFKYISCGNSQIRSNQSFNAHHPIHRVSFQLLWPL